MRPIHIHPLSALAGAAALLLTGMAQGVPQLAPVVLTPQEKEILSHMSIVYLDDAQGGVAKTIRVSGVNVQIVNGLGATNGNPADPETDDLGQVVTNGVGNLIVGYNEPGNPFFNDRTGSHNIVVGHGLSYDNWAGIVVGRDNAIRNGYASTIGGQRNRAVGLYSVAIAGRNNWSIEAESAIVGGAGNVATGQFAGVFGGAGCSASASYAATLGGNVNTASAQWATVTGGELNTASGNASSISGGRNNDATEIYSSVAGGEENTAAGPNSSVSGGFQRTAPFTYNWQAGGLSQNN